MNKGDISKRAHGLDRRHVLTGISASLVAVVTNTATLAQGVQTGNRLDQIPFLSNILPSQRDLGIMGVGSFSSISGGPDNGANNCLAQHIWQAARHSTTEQAFRNVLAKMPAALTTGAGNIIFGGHGNEGYLETGGGQSGSDWKTQALLSWNESYWGPHADTVRGKQWIMAYIYSCHSGAGERGAELLYKLATRLDRPVAGRTGFTYCGGGKGITFEAGSVWQVATPGIMPSPIEAPSPHLTSAMFPERILVPIEGILRELRTDQVRVVNVAVTGAGEFAGRSTRVRPDRQVSAVLIRALFASEPQRLPGEPTAMVTARVTLMVGASTLSIELLNGRLTRVVGSDIVYRAAAGIDELLRVLS